MTSFRQICAMFVTAFVMLGAGEVARAQADAPPEREGKPTPAPSTLPPVDAPKPATQGKLTLTFEGAKAFPEKDLKDALKRQIADIESSGLDDASAYDAAFFLDTYYRKHGYSSVEVNSEIKGPWALTLRVSEGPRTKIAAFHIRGSKAYDDKTLINYLLGPTRERFPDIKVDTELPFVEADLNSGTDLVKRLYASEGYLDAVIDPLGIQLSRDKTTAVVTLVIHEGRQYHFGKISIIGNKVFTTAQLRTAIADDLSKPFTDGRLAAAQRKLEDFYKKRGYFAVKVDESSAKDAAVKGRVPASFTITEGARYHFGGITTKGLRDVKPGFLEKRFQKLQGKTYDPELIDKEFREMIQTGLFKSLRITPRAVDGDEVQLDLVAEEAKEKSVGFSVGYSSFEKEILGISYSDRNLFGTGRPFTLSAELNGLGYKGEVLYTDPWLFDSDYELKLRAYALTEDLEGYSKFEFGFQPSLTRKITDHWEVSAFVLTKRVKIESFEIEPAELVGKTEYGLTSAGITQSIDYRDNKMDPRKGFIFVTTFDGSLNGFGSDVSFVRGTARFSWYIPVTHNTDLAIGARGGIISTKGGPDALPIDERFFNGGANSVRSFQERELGPRDILGYPIGGTAYTTFNVEYTFPIAGDLKGAVFGDAGNVTTSVRQYGLTEMRYAVGAGLRYNLPFGPVRLDAGFNPSHKDGEDRGAILFSIGVAF